LAGRFFIASLFSIVIHIRHFSPLFTIKPSRKVPCSEFGKALADRTIPAFERLRWLCIHKLNDYRKEHYIHTMIKKAVFALMLALALTSTVPVATANVDIPPCYPCDGTN
jgi:hypothetical protein